MSQGWMRVREAAHLMGVSQTTVRRRMESEELRSRVGRSGRQEVFLPAKLRRELEAAQTEPCPPGHLERGKAAEDGDAASTEVAAKCEATPAESVEEVSCGCPETGESGSDLVRRYERLAGGSLILAQQHSDELHKHQATAFEQLAHTRNQLREVRRVAMLGWACCAAALVFGLFFSITFGVGMSRAQAAADASASYAEQAEKHAAAQRRELDRALPAQGVKPAGSSAQSPDAGASDGVAEVPTRGPREATRRGAAQRGQTASVPTE